MLHRGEKINIQVDTVLPFGVFCRVIADGSRGYIRRRELTLQGTIDPRSVVQPGDFMDVVVLELATEGKITELSRRKLLPDPWVEFGAKAHTRDIVRGSVKYVGLDRVIVEIRPGVDGIIAMEDLSITPVQRPEEIVWPGDHIEAMILRIDPGARKLQLSIRHRLEREQLISQLLGEVHEHQGKSPAQLLDPEGELPESHTAFHYTGHILVAEDDPDVRVALTQWLESEGCQVTACSNGAEALECTDRQGFSLLFTDINMPAIDGVSLVRQIRQKNPKTVCVFLSDPDHINQNLVEIDALSGYIITKPIDPEELRLFLQELSNGSMPARVSPPPAEENSPFHYFEGKIAGMRSVAPLVERIEIALAHLLGETGAEKVILFHYDPISRLISIMAQVGSLPLDETQVNYLVASPVEDVITEDIVIWDNYLSSNSSERFGNLLRLLTFEACIGMPVRTGEERNHALFIFHSQPDVFSRYRVRDVQTAAALISVALEEELYRSHVRDSNSLILNGQMSSAFNHEIYNKISVLDFQLDTLTSAYSSLLDILPQMNNLPQTGQVNKALGEVVQAVGTINRMAVDFRRIMKGGASQPISINQIVQEACGQVRPAADKALLTLTQELDTRLPDIRVNQFALQYVVYNLLINAVQHLENSPGERQVKVQTGASCENNAPHIYIRVEDNGPGIHCQLWEKIFELGFTTRPGGSGLGLYIARNLIETLGGTINVEDSLIRVGTVFKIEIPVEAAHEQPFL